MRVLMIGPARSVKGGMTTVVDNYYKCGLDKKVDLKYIETINDHNILSKFFKELIGVFEFRLNIKKYDIVHVHMASRRSTFRKAKYIRLAKKNGKKIIIHIHGAEYKKFFEECSSKQREYIKNTLNMSDKVIVLSEEWKDYFKKIIDESKIIVIYNAIILPNDFDKDVNTKKILFLGRLGKRKGIYDLLDVMSEIVKNDANVKLYIGGDGEVEQVKNVIVSDGLQNNVKYVGWISGKQKEELLKNCSIYILPSYNEGMPMSVLEAMAYKNVTISTNVGGIPKVICNEQNGIIINPGDKKTLNNYINKILIDEDFRKKLSLNARSTIEQKFNMEKNLEKILEIYENV